MQKRIDGYYRRKKKGSKKRVHVPGHMVKGKRKMKKK
jgi:hypothetical protein